MDRIDGKFMGTISEDFVQVSDFIKEASYVLRKSNFAFPIFVLTKSDTEIGQLLIHQHERGLRWNYYVSYLDEFVQRDLVATEKIDEFKSIYKDPDEFCCLFVMEEAFTQFVFIPYPID